MNKILPLPKLTVGKLFEECKESLRLELLTDRSGFDREIAEGELHRPGLALAGFIELFTYKRIQIIGNTETRYLNSLNKTARITAIEQLLQFEIPCIIITDSNVPTEEMLQMARKRKISILRTEYATTLFYHLLGDYLQSYFAPRTVIHGTLVDVYGIGLLFTGRSGIGKSEVALDLVERGHRLVADDQVIVTRKAEEILIGEGQDISQHLMEIRGLGLIDIKRIYGIWAVRVHKRIEVVIDLVDFDEKVDYDRTGLDEKTRNILGVEIPLIVLPINPGKNITVIAETIAMNQMLKLQGHNTAQEFNERLLQRLREKEKKHLEELKKRTYLDKDFE